MKCTIGSSETSFYPKRQDKGPLQIDTTPTEDTNTPATAHLPETRLLAETRTGRVLCFGIDPATICIDIKALTGNHPERVRQRNTIKQIPKKRKLGKTAEGVFYSRSSVNSGTVYSFCNLLYIFVVESFSIPSRTMSKDAYKIKASFFSEVFIGEEVELFALFC